MTNPTRKNSGWNPTPAQYIRLNRHKRSRFEIDSHLLSFGHNPLEIEAAWQQLNQIRTTKTKPTALKFQPLKLYVKLLLAVSTVVTLAPVLYYYWPNYWAFILQDKVTIPIVVLNAVLIVVCLLSIRWQAPVTSRSKAAERFQLFTMLYALYVIILCLVFSGVLFSQGDLLDSSTAADSLFFRTRTQTSTHPCYNADDCTPEPPTYRIKVTECDRWGFGCRVNQVYNTGSEQ